MQRIIQRRLSQTLARPTITRLHRATGGNPMMCLEMARALQRRGAEPSASDPLPVPADLQDPGHRAAARTRTADTGGAAAGGRARAAHGDCPGGSSRGCRSAARCLEEAVAAGVLEVDGERVRFTHPLIASIPYADLSPVARRALHERLAATATDPEERARHAALGSDEPSSVVAAALDSAARQARRRGSIDAAAELAQLALRRTPASDPAGQLRRTVDAARYLFLLGDPVRARALLEAGLDKAPPGPARVDGLLLGASIASWESGDATVASWCEQALAEAGQDTLLLARSHATFAETSPSGAAVDLFHAEAAAELLEAMTAPPAGLLANVLTNVAMHRFRLGRGLSVVDPGARRGSAGAGGARPGQRPSRPRPWHVPQGRRPLRGITRLAGDHADLRRRRGGRQRAAHHPGAPRRPRVLGGRVRPRHRAGQGGKGARRADGDPRSHASFRACAGPGPSGPHRRRHGRSASATSPRTSPPASCRQ